MKRTHVARLNLQPLYEKTLPVPRHSNSGSFALLGLILCPNYDLFENALEITP